MGIVRRTILSVLFLAGLAPFGTGAAVSQEVDAAAVPQQINLYDVLLQYPQPAWISGQIAPGDLIDRSEFFKQQTGPQFILEQIPAGESFARWTQLFAVVAEQLGAGQVVPMGTFVDLAVASNREACARDGFAFQPLGASERDAIVLMVCGSTENGPPDVGYGPGVGEVSLWRFIVYKNTYMKLYQRWRGAAFGIDERGDWPINDAGLQEMFRRIAGEVSVAPVSARR